MKSCASSLLIFGTVFVFQALGAADSKPTRWEPPNAEQAETLGRCRVDGNLHCTFDLGVIDLGGGLRIPLRLVHELQVSSERKALSVWRVQGLQSFVVPADRTHLLWLSPQLGRVEIERKFVGPGLTLIGRGAWMIRELGPGDWDLKDGDGGVWSYREGALTGIATGLGFDVHVTSHGEILRSTVKQCRRHCECLSSCRAVILMPLGDTRPTKPVTTLPS